jgi:hypothetical protein
MVSWVKALVKAVVAYVGVPTIYCDNEALVNDVHGNSEVKSVRHMEQKMYYCREEYLKSAYQLKFMDGRSYSIEYADKGCSKFIGLCEKCEVMTLV